ncbi:MAG: Zn-binding domain-containing protein [Acidimicrobiia bacterium]|nr:Zn-binding domain-containing protein [Acidimicrobiia bacterium]
MSTALHPDTGLPTIVVHDGYPGGAGIAELGFDAGHDHLTATLEVVSSCGCDTGCPRVVRASPPSAATATSLPRQGRRRRPAPRRAGLTHRSLRTPRRRLRLQAHVVDQSPRPGERPSGTR